MTTKYGIAYDLEPDDLIAEVLGALLDEAVLTEEEMIAYLAEMHKEAN